MAEPSSAKSRPGRTGRGDSGGPSAEASSTGASEETRPLGSGGAELPGWLTEAVGDGHQSQQQALALMGLGLMHRLAGQQEAAWTWRADEDGGQADGQALRARLESIDLAIRTGAPLSTAEITYLLGARPGSAVTERGGLQARRLNRNVWVLTRSGSTSLDRDDRGSQAPASSFYDGRRRF